MQRIKLPLGHRAEPLRCEMSGDWLSIALIVIFAVAIATALSSAAWEEHQDAVHPEKLQVRALYRAEVLESCIVLAFYCLSSQFLAVSAGDQVRRAP